MGIGSKAVIQRPIKNLQLFFFTDQAFQHLPAIFPGGCPYTLPTPHCPYTMSTPYYSTPHCLVTLNTNPNYDQKRRCFFKLTLRLDRLGLALGDRHRKFYRTLNNAKKPSIQYSIQKFVKIMHSKFYKFKI